MTEKANIAIRAIIKVKASIRFQASPSVPEFTLTLMQSQKK